MTDQFDTDEVSGVEGIISIRKINKQKAHDKEQSVIAAQSEFDTYMRTNEGELDQAKVDAYKSAVPSWTYEQSMYTLEGEYDETSPYAKNFKQVTDAHLAGGGDPYANLSYRDNSDRRRSWQKRISEVHNPAFIDDATGGMDAGDDDVTRTPLAQSKHEAVAVAQYIADTTGMDTDDVVDNLTMLIPKFVQLEDGKFPTVSDAFNQIKGQLTKDKQVIDNAQRNVTLGRSSAIKGLSLKDAIATLDPDSKTFASDKANLIAGREDMLDKHSAILPKARDIFNKFADKTERGERFSKEMEENPNIAGVISGVASAIETPKQQLDAVVDLALMPRQQRLDTLAILWQMADEGAGELDAGFFGKTGESFMRGLDSHVNNIGDFASMSIEQTGLAGRSEDLDRLKRELRQDLIDVRDTVTEIRSDYDFVQGVYDNVRSAPYSITAMLPYGAGVLLNSASMAVDNDKALRKMHPEWDAKSRYKVSATAGIIQGGLERASFKSRWGGGFTKTIKGFAGMSGKRILGMVATRTAAGLAVENIEEALQSATLPIMQNVWGAFSDEIPDVSSEDWSKHGRDTLFFDKRTFFATLPTAVIGGGGRSAIDIMGARRSKEIMSNVDTLMLSGLSEDKARAIANEPDVLKQYMMFKHDLDYTPINERKEFAEEAIENGALERVEEAEHKKGIENLKAEIESTGSESDKAKLTVELVRQEHAAKFNAKIKEVSDSEFEVIFPNATSKPTEVFKTIQEAEQAVEAHQTETHENYLEEIHKSVASSEALKMFKGNLKKAHKGASIKLNEKLASLEDFAAKGDAEMKQALERVEFELFNKGIVRPATVEDFKNWKVRGEVKLKKAARGYVARISEGGDISDLVEEGSEGFLRDLVDNNMVDANWVKTKILQYQNDTGDKITSAKSVDSMSYQQMVEAFSNLAKGNFWNASQNNKLGELGGLVNALRAFFAQVMKIANNLSNLQKEGKIDADFQKLLDNSVGLDMDEQVTRQTEEARQEIAGGETTMSIGSAQDATYMDAVNSGDMDKAQAMVDAKIEKSPYLTRVKRGDGKAFEVFDKSRRGESTKASSAKKAFFFTDEDSPAQTFAWMAANNEAEVHMRDEQEQFIAEENSAWKDAEADILAYANDSKTDTNIAEFINAYNEAQDTRQPMVAGIAEQNNYFGSENVKRWVNAGRSIISESSPEWLTYRQDTKKKLGLEDRGIVRDFVLKLNNYNEIDYKGESSRGGEITYADAIDKAEAEGKDGVILRNTHDAGEVINIYAVFEPSQIKLADPVTYDADGNVIPLSQRFDEGKDEITFSIGRAEITPTANTQMFPTKDGGVVGAASFSIGAWHGTPHDILNSEEGRLTTDRIGSGEGAQAYGWGLYSAQDKGVGEDYRKNLSGGLKYLLGVTPKLDINAYMGNKIVRHNYSAKDVNDEFDILDIDKPADFSYEKARSNALDILAKGNLYKVELNVEQDELLDWDKPLSEQSDAVKTFYKGQLKEALPEINKLLDQLGVDRNAPISEDAPSGDISGEQLYKEFVNKSHKNFMGSVKDINARMRELGKIMSGDEVSGGYRQYKSDAGREAAREYDELMETRSNLVRENQSPDPYLRGGAKQASQALHAQGIKGIKYLDGNSRSDGEGTYNYVIFNDKDIRITEENGEVVDTTFSLAPAEDSISTKINALMSDPSTRNEVYQQMATKLHEVRQRIYRRHIAYGDLSEDLMNESEKEMGEREFIISMISQVEAIASVLPPKVRKKLGTGKQLAEFKTGKAMRRYVANRLDKVDSALEKHLRKEKRERIQSLLNRSNPSSRRASDAGQSKLGAVGHEIAKAARLAIHMSPEQAEVEAQLVMIAAEKDEGKTSDSLQEAADIAYVYEMFADIKNADSNRLTVMADLLQSNWDEGRKAWKKVLKDRKDWKDEKIDSIVSELGGVASEGETNTARSVKFMSTFKTILSEGVSWYQLTDILREGFKRGGAADRTVKEMADDLRKASNAFEWAQHQHKEKMLKVFSEIFGISGTNKTARVRSRLNKISKGIDWGNKVTISIMKEVKVSANMGELDQASMKLDADPDLNEVTVRNVTMTRDEFDEMFVEFQNQTAEGFDPNEKTLFHHSFQRLTGERESIQTMSQLDLLKDWLALQQSDLKEKYEKTGHDEKYSEQLDEALDSDVKELGLWMQDELRRNTPKTNAIHRDQYGLNMALVENYFPAEFAHMGKEDTALAQEADPSIGGVSKRPSAHKMRVSHGKSPKRHNAVNKFNQHVMQDAFWTTHAEVIRKWSGVVNNEDVQNAMLRVKGKEFLQTFNTSFGGIETQGAAVVEAQLASDMIWRSLGRGMAMGVLGFKISTIMKNFAAALNVAVGVEIPELMRGLKPELFREARELLKSETFQRRLKMGASVATRVAMQGNKTGNIVTATAGRLGEYSIQGINIADTGANMTMALAYTAKLRELKKAGVPEAEAKAQALDRVDDLMARFAQPTDRLSKSAWENHRLPMMAFLVMFQSEARKMTAINVMALRKLATGKGVQSRGMAAQQLIVNTVVVSLFIHAVNSLYRAAFKGDGEGDDAEEKFINSLTDPKTVVTQMLADSLSGVPLAGEAWAGLVGKVFDQKTYSSTSNPIIKTAMQSYSKTSRIIDEWDETTEGEKVDGIATAIQMLGQITPPTAILAAGANAVKDAQGFFGNTLSKGLTDDDTIAIYRKRITDAVSSVTKDTKDEMEAAVEAGDLKLQYSIKNHRRDEATRRGQDILMTMPDDLKNKLIEDQYAMKKGRQIPVYILNLPKN